MGYSDLGPLSYYSNIFVRHVDVTYTNKKNSFHLVMQHSSKALHSTIQLVENLALLLKETATDILNSKAVSKLNENVLVPTINNLLFVRDKTAEQAQALYHKIFR